MYLDIPDLDEEKEIYVIFYTPDTDMAETEPYVCDMPWYTRIARQMSHSLNKFNSSCTTKTLEWSMRDKTMTLTNNEYQEKKEQGNRANKNEIETNPLDSYQVTKVGSQVIQWTDTAGGTQYHRPFYSHVELIMDGGQVTYCIRWGEKLSKLKKVYRSDTCNMYTTLKLVLQSSAYTRLKLFCESSLKRDMTFNYYGLYFNFLPVPAHVRQSLHANGSSYWTSDSVFCSEFIARAFCFAGIFTDKTGIWVDPKSHREIATLKPKDSTLGDVQMDHTSLGEYMDSTGNVFVDPATTSPNMLYLFLKMKKYALQRRQDSFELDIWPFSGEPHSCITNSFLPTMRA